MLHWSTFSTFSFKKQALCSIFEFDVIKDMSLMLSSKTFLTGVWFSGPRSPKGFQVAQPPPT